jgi:hypothetical protein
MANYTSKPCVFNVIGEFVLLDRCLTGQPMAQVAEKRIMGLLREVTE